MRRLGVTRWCNGISSTLHSKYLQVSWPDSALFWIRRGIVYSGISDQCNLLMEEPSNIGMSSNVSFNPLCNKCVKTHPASSTLKLSPCCAEYTFPGDQLGSGPLVDIVHMDPLFFPTNPIFCPCHCLEKYLSLIHI